MRAGVVRRQYVAFQDGLFGGFFFVLDIPADIAGARCRAADLVETERRGRALRRPRGSTVAAREDRSGRSDRVAGARRRTVHSREIVSRARRRGRPAESTVAALQDRAGGTHGHAHRSPRGAAHPTEVGGGSRALSTPAGSVGRRDHAARGSHRDTFGGRCTAHAAELVPLRGWIEPLPRAIGRPRACSERLPGGGRRGHRAGQRRTDDGEDVIAPERAEAD